MGNAQRPHLHIASHEACWRAELRGVPSKLTMQLVAATCLAYYDLQHVPCTGLMQVPPVLRAFHARRAEMASFVTSLQVGRASDMLVTQCVLWGPWVLYRLPQPTASKADVSLVLPSMPVCHCRST